jgi:hypothetical protein
VQQYHPNRVESSTGYAEATADVRKDTSICAVAVICGVVWLDFAHVAGAAGTIPEEAAPLPSAKIIIGALHGIERPSERTVAISPDYGRFGKLSPLSPEKK